MDITNKKFLKYLTTSIDEYYDKLAHMIYELETKMDSGLIIEKDKCTKNKSDYELEKEESFQKIRESIDKYFSNEKQDKTGKNTKISATKILPEITIFDTLVSYYITRFKVGLKSDFKVLEIYKKYKKVVEEDCLDFYVDTKEFMYIIQIIELSNFNLNEQFSTIVYFIEKILESNRLYNKDTTEFELSLQEIKKHYTDKTDSYTKEDVEIIVKNLISIGFDINFCEQIGIKLLKQITKKDMNLNIDFGIKKFDYKKIESELNKYIDFRNMKITKLLSVEEIIKVVSLLMKINTDKEEIRKFLDNAHLEINKLNPVSKYVQLRDKLKYYQDKYGIEEEIKILDDYFESLIICDEEEYVFFKNCLSEDLRKVLSYLPKSYDYEFNEADKLKK